MEKMSVSNHNIGLSLQFEKATHEIQQKMVKPKSEKNINIKVEYVSCLDEYSRFRLNGLKQLLK